MSTMAMASFRSRIFIGTLSIPSGSTRTGINLDTDGRMYSAINNTRSTEIFGSWIVGQKTAGIGANYEARMVLLSGAIATGTMIVGGTWAADSTWVRLNNPFGFGTNGAGSFRIEIRPFNGARILESTIMVVT